MITWSFALCLKLAALGAVGQCAPSERGSELAAFVTTTTPEEGAIVNCKTTACVDWVRADTTHTVVSLPRRNAFLLLPRGIPEEEAGRIILLARGVGR